MAPTTQPTQVKPSTTPGNVPASSPAAAAATAPTTQSDVAAASLRFKQKAGKRLPRVLTAIKSLQNLMSDSPSENQRNFILSQVQGAMDELKKVFEGAKPKQISMEIPD